MNSPWDRKDGSKFNCVTTRPTADDVALHTYSLIEVFLGRIPDDVRLISILNDGSNWIVTVCVANLDHDLDAEIKGIFDDYLDNVAIMRDAWSAYDEPHFSQTVHYESQLKIDVTKDDLQKHLKVSGRPIYCKRERC